MPVKSGREIVCAKLDFGGKEYSVTAVNVGNSHCVIFCDKVDDVDMDALGQAVLASGLFPDLAYLDCARIVNDLDA